MGESTNLQGRLPGQFNLNDFLGQINNDVTPQKMVKTISPVQEMRHFQRRYRFDSGVQLLAIGERIVQVRWIVPAGEYWKPIGLSLFNGDSANHTIETAVTVDNASIVLWRLSSTIVGAGVNKVVYGLTLDGSVGSGTDRNFQSKVPMTMEPADVFVLTDVTPATGTPTMRWTFVYELVPAPATLLTQGVDGLVAVA